MRPAKEIAPVDAIIIDCFYVAYRGFCSTPPLQSKDGTPTNAIHGILGAVSRMVKDLQPKSVIVATEGKTNLRDQMSADYKAGRELPPRFSQQIPLIYKMCMLSGWHLLESDGYEADDVIVTVGRRMRELHLRAAVFSTDKDIISRISDEFGIIGIFKTEKGKSFILEAADYMAKWGVSPALIPEVLCLCGDSVDNVPGIKGVGEKTAVRLIQEFGGVAGIYANLDKVKPDKLRARLDQPGSRASLKMSQELIQLNENLPIDDAIFQAGRQQAEDLHEFFLSLDMVKTAASLGLSPAPPAPDSPIPTAPAAPVAPDVQQALPI